MKKVLIPILLFATIVTYLSCQKEHGSGPLPVAAEKTEGIKKGEPILFSVEGDNAQWAVSPGNAKITANGNRATILFAKAGSYVVTANTDYTNARITVNVTDTSWCTDTTRHCDTSIIDTCRYGNCIPRDSIYAIESTDQIFLKPIKNDTGNVSGLLFQATTVKYYPCTNNSLATAVITTGFDTTSRTYTFDYQGVVVPASCNGGSKRATSFSMLYPMPDGTHTLKAVLRGITYTGSITKSGNQYSIYWPYTSGVVISPKTL